MSHLGSLVQLGLWDLATIILRSKEFHSNLQDLQLLRELLIALALHPTDSSEFVLSLYQPWQICIYASRLLELLPKKCPEISQVIFTSTLDTEASLNLLSETLPDSFEKEFLHCDSPNNANFMHHLLQILTHDPVSGLELLGILLQKKLPIVDSVYNTCLTHLLEVLQSTGLEIEQWCDACQKDRTESLIQHQQILLQIVALSSNYSLPEGVLEQLVGLSDCCVIPSVHVWLCLAARGSNNLSIQAQQIADTLAGRIRDPIKHNITVKSIQRCLQPANMCLWTLQTQTHWLEYILDSCCHLCIEGHETEVRELMKENFMISLYPALLLWLWKDYKLRMNLYPILERFTKDFQTTDSVINDMLASMHQQITLVKWCAGKCSGNNSCSPERLFQLADQGRDSLWLLPLLDSVLQLSVSDWDELQDTLIITGNTGVNTESASSGNTNITEGHMFRAFCLLRRLIEALAFVADLKPKKTKNTNYTSFEEKVTTPISMVMTEALNIQPLSFRVEVLQAMFCLLFLRNSDWKDDTSDSSPDVEFDQFPQKSFNNLIASDSEVDRDGFLPGPADSVISQSSPVPSSSNHKKKVRRYPSISGSASGTSGSVRKSNIGRGFVVGNIEVVWLILDGLHEAIVASKASAFQTGQQLNSLINLAQYVTEARWRLELTQGQQNVELNHVRPFSYPHKKDKDDEITDKVTAGIPSESPELFRHRKYCAMGSSSQKCSSCGPISLMLASPSSLTIMCMKQKQTGKAKQVIKTFGLQNSLLEVEVEFSDHFQACVNMLENNPGFCTKGRGLGSTPSNLQALLESAAAGVGSTWATSHVEKFVKGNQLPAPAKLQSVSPNTHSALQGIDNPSLLIILDLALTTGNVPENSLAILQLATNQFQHSKTAKQNLKGPVGPIAFAQQLHSLYEEMCKESWESISSLQRYSKVGISLPDLLCSTLPLQPQAFRQASRLWTTLQNVLQDVASALQKLAQINTEEQVSPRHQAEAVIGVHVALRGLSNLPVYNRCGDTNEGDIDYLRSVLHHLRLLTSVVVKLCPSDYPSLQCYLNILHESPATLLTRMILVSDIPPQELEPLAKRLRLSLTLELVGTCCPSVTTNVSNTTELLPAGLCDDWSIGQIVLNAYTGPPLPASQRRPLELVIKLLTMELEGQLPLERRLLECHALQQADLQLLSSDDERLCFFINICLLLKLLIQDLCTKGCTPLSFGASWSFGLQIGQLGFVNLPLLTQALTDSDCKKLWGTFNPTADPRVLFLLEEPRKKIQIVQPDTLEVTLSQVMSHSLSTALHLHYNKDGLEIAVPDAWLKHVYLFVNGVSYQKQPVPDFALTDVRKIKFDGVQAVQILAILIEHTQGPKQLALRKAMSSDCIILAPASKKRERKTSSVSANSVPFANNEIMSHFTLRVRDYLQEKCWPILVLAQLLLDEEKSLDPNLTSNYFPLKAIVQSSLTKRWGMQIVLGGGPSIKELWKKIDCHMNQKDWATVLTIIDELPDALLAIDPRLVSLRDSLLAEGGCSFIRHPILQALVFCHQVQTQPNAKMVSQLKMHLNQLVPKHISDELHQWSKLLDICQKVVESEIYPNITDWYEIQNMTVGKVLQDLINNGQFLVALEWISHHNIESEVTLEADTAYLIFLLGSIPPNITKTIDYLESLPPHRSASVGDRLLASSSVGLSGTPEIQKALVNFLLSRCQKNLTPQRLRHLKHLNIGLKLWELLPNSDRQVCAPLAHKPRLLVEQLILLLRLDALRNELPKLRSDIIDLGDDSACSLASLDRLLETYATKALDWRSPVLSSVISSSPATSQTDQSFNDISSDGSQANMLDGFQVPHSAPSRSEWIPDSQTEFCMCCQTSKFSVFNRRHHCRRCGRLVCRSCSSHRLKVVGCGDVPVRVCSDCWSIASQSQQLPVPSSLALQVAAFEFQFGEPMWHLRLDEEHNHAIRQEFSFNDSPSISLCLALLAPHSNTIKAAKFLMVQCEDAMNAVGSDDPQADASVLLSMARHLFVAARMHLPSEAVLQEAVNALGRCDGLGHHLELLQLLHRAGVSDLGSFTRMPRHQLLYQLVEKEQWTLALEVAGKAGMDASGVWGGWGMALLRTGDLTAAREKLCRCLGSTKCSSSMLEEIVRTLQSIKMEYVGGKEIDNVMSLISSVEPIALQVITHGKVHARVNKSSNRLQQECLFYLETFGGCESVVKFLVEECDDKEAVLRVPNMPDPIVAAEIVGITIISKGRIAQLKEALLAADATLNKYTRFIHAIYHLLSRKGWLSSLLDLQLFCKDSLRAAQTCEHCAYPLSASTYSIISAQSYWVEQALNHLCSYLSNRSPVKTPLCLVLPKSEVEKWISTLKLQKQVVDILSQSEQQYESCTIRWLSLLGYTNGGNLPLLRGQTANPFATVLLCLLNKPKSTAIAFQVIEECQLPVEKVFLELARFLSLHYSDSCHKVEQLAKFIVSSQLSNARELADKILCQAAIDTEHPEALVALIQDSKRKFQILFTLGHLKDAYIIAVKNKWSDKVSEILSEAEKQEQPSVIRLCRQWLQKKHCDI